MSPGLVRSLRSFLQAPVCILGIGNRLWRDDGAGSRLAEDLAGCEGLLAIDGGMVPENFLERVVCHAPRSVLLVDAADFGGAPGALRLLAPDALSEVSLSTHAGSPQTIARYLQARCGAQVALLAVQPGDLRAGDALSPAVAGALDELAGWLLKLGQAVGQAGSDQAN